MIDYSKETPVLVRCFMIPELRTVAIDALAGYYLKEGSTYTLDSIYRELGGVSDEELVIKLVRSLERKEANL